MSQVFRQVITSTAWPPRGAKRRGFDACQRAVAWRAWLVKRAVTFREPELCYAHALERKARRLWHPWISEGVPVLGMASGRPL